MSLTVIDDNKQIDISNCRVRSHSTGSSECMVITAQCPWRINGGRVVIEHEIHPIMFCMHESASSIAKSTRKRRA